MAVYLIWNVRVICAGNVNKGQKQCITWRIGGGGSGEEGVYWGAFLNSVTHSLTHSLVHPFTRLVVAPLAAPPSQLTRAPCAPAMPFVTCCRSDAATAFTPSAGIFFFFL